MLETIRIVLVNTSHPGNIGSVARAMKTMGLSDLYLVSPAQFPHDKAVEMASGSGDLLENAKVVQTLDEAIADCSLVIGASARKRTISLPLFSPRDMAKKIAEEKGTIAILFGREQSGLSNDELKRCHLQIYIPANPDYCSLNLAAAVQIIAYELRMNCLDSQIKEDCDSRFATSEEMEGFFTHLQRVLIDIDFLKMRAPRKLMARLRRLFFRARPDVMEINILRGMLTAITSSIKKEGN